MDVVDFRVRLPTELRPPVKLPPEYVDRYDAILSLEERPGHEPRSTDR